MSDKKDIEWQFSNDPTSHTDAVHIAAKKSGDLVLMQFFSYIPNRIIENHRTMITLDNVKELIDDLAEMVDYYPIKKSEKPKRKKESASASK